MTVVDDETRFRLFASYIRTLAERLLTEVFGERCDEFEASCEVCRRWKLLDDLLANPFSAPERTTVRELAKKHGMDYDSVSDQQEQIDLETGKRMGPE